MLLLNTLGVIIVVLLWLKIQKIAKNFNIP